MPHDSKRSVNEWRFYFHYGEHRAGRLQLYETAHMGMIMGYGTDGVNWMADLFLVFFLYRAQAGEDYGPASTWESIRIPLKTLEKPQDSQC